MAFPILRLLFLVFQMVFESMGFIELFLLTRLSDKMKRIVKGRVKIRNYKMKVYCDDNFRLSILNENQKELFVVDVLEKQDPNSDDFPLKLGNADGISSGFYFDEDCEDLLVTFWNDLMVGHKEFFNEIIELFPCPIEFVSIENVGQDCETLVQWASALTIEEVSLTGENFGLHHLQALNVPSITLYDSSLSDQDIHNFLHDMSNGRSNTNLKEMSILFDRDDSNYNFITRGLNVLYDEDENADPVDSQLQIYHLTLSNGETGTIKYVFATVETPDRPDREYWGYDVKILRREVNQ